MEESKTETKQVIVVDGDEQAATQVRWIANKDRSLDDPFKYEIVACPDQESMLRQIREGNVVAAVTNRPEFTRMLSAGTYGNTPEVKLMPVILHSVENAGSKALEAISRRAQFILSPTGGGILDSNEKVTSEGIKFLEEVIAEINNHGLHNTLLKFRPDLYGPLPFQAPYNGF